MDSNYKKIKKVLSEEQSNLPPELNWDEMESGILNKMDTLESEIQSERKNRSNRGFIYIGLVLILILTPLICTQLSEQTKQDFLVEDLNINNGAKQQANVYVTASSDTKTNSESKAIDQTSKSILLPDTETLEKEESENNSKTTIATDFDGNTASTSNSNIDNSGFTKSQVGFEFNNDMNLMNKRNGEMLSWNSSIKSAPIVSNFQSKNKEEIESILKENSKILIAKIESKESYLMMENQKNIKLFQPIQIKPQIVDFSHQNNLSLSSGISFWNMGYGNNKPEREAFEKSMLSFSTNLNYIRTLKNNLLLMVGVQYQQFESRFDWMNQVEDHKVLLTDVVVEIQQNSITGGQQEVRGDVEVEVEATRTVRNYNRSYWLQLPLAVGKKYNFGKWRANFFIGGAFSFLSGHKGKTLYQGEIIDYEGSSTPFINTQWNVNALVQSGISYELHKNLSVGANFQYQRSITNWSTENEVSMRPHIFSMHLGITTSF